MWYEPTKGNHKQHINSFNKMNVIFLSKKINILYIYIYIMKDFLWPTTSHGWSILFWVRFDCSTFISYFQHTSFVSQALFFFFSIQLSVFTFFPSHIFTFYLIFYFVLSSINSSSHTFTFYLIFYFVLSSINSLVVRVE